MSIPSPWDRYQELLASGQFSHDHAQEQAVRELQSVYESLLPLHTQTAKKGIRARIRKKKRQYPQGLYMWGGVGRGKTWLMDTFYESLPHKKKVRIHFHRFMQQVHDELNKLGNIKNPLEKVADTIVGNARIICFDEFFVSDITDAMLLGGLFTELFDRGITLVTTSNIVPAGLYKDGLQRERFMPAIEMLEQHCQVLNVDSGTDYRLRTLEQAEIYHYPNDDAAKTLFEKTFDELAPTEGKRGLSLDINHRQLNSIRVADDVVWFSFEELCDGPRSQADYIELARQFHTVLLSDVPQLTWETENQARRFINLIDEFYDRSVILIISADTPLTEIYSGKRVAFEFDRTVSRLLEMQSHEYLGRAHKP